MLNSLLAFKCSKEKTERLWTFYGLHVTDRIILLLASKCSLARGEYEDDDEHYNREAEIQFF